MNQTTTNITSSHRNNGIDLLRLVAAFYVIILHTINRGGIYSAVTEHSNQEYICNILLIIAFCAVNIFGIISGYVGYREPPKKISYSGYLPLWLTVVFYCVMFNGIYWYFFPDTITYRDLFKSFFPVTKDLFWYFSAYTVVYFFSPFLNKMLYYSSQAELKQLFFFICCILVTIDYIGQPFALEGGYSSLWLLLLYMLGGIMKKTGIGSKLPAYAAFFAIVIIDIVFFYISRGRSNFTVFIFSLNLDVRYSYVTPIYLATAILHVILFSKFKIPKLGERIINFSAPAAFSVYIANTNPAIWNNFMKNRFVNWATSSPIGILVRTVLFSLSFVVIVVIFDFFRQKLFRILGVQNLTQKLTKIFHRTKTG